MAAGTKKAKPTRTAAILGKIEKAIACADLSKVPAEKLLALRLQYIEAVKTETPPRRKAVKCGSVEEILAAYSDLINEVRAGSITTEQAAKENSILAGMIKAIETSQLKARIEEIERILNNDE